MSVDNVQERTGVVTFKGQPMTLLGPQLRAGDPAPDFGLTGSDLSPVTREILLDRGKRGAFLIVVPSLDTSVCSLESQTFNQRFNEIPSGMQAAVVSMDLPFAQARWSAAQSDVKLQMLSDYRDRSFGLNYGLAIAELGLLARAVVVIDNTATISYVQIVPEIASEPDYDSALKAASASKSG